MASIKCVFLELLQSLYLANVALKITTCPKSHTYVDIVIRRVKHENIPGEISFTCSLLEISVTKFTKKRGLANKELVLPILPNSEPHLYFCVSEKFIHLIQWFIICLGFKFLPY